MKKSIIYLAMLAVGFGTALVACDDNFERPPMVVPVATMEANTTIAELKAEFYQTANNYAVEVGTKKDGSHYIIKGRVTTSDEAGNFFKQLVIQDETSAIQISVDAYDLYLSYQMGQEVVVDVTGLYIGAYGRLMQLGAAPTSGYPSRIAEATFQSDKVAQLNGLSNPAAIAPAVVTIAELQAIKADKTKWLDWQCKLITINDVTFDNAGKQTLSTSGSNGVSQNFGNSEGKIILYTSGYSDFYDYYCPTGKGSVTGILSCYNDNWQVRLNSIEGLEGFETLEKAPSVSSADIVTSINQNFNASTEIPDGWSQIQVAGNKSWYVTTFQENNYIAMTGYKGTAPFDQYLLTPPIDMSKVTDKVLTFDTQVNGYGSKTTKIEVLVLTDSDLSKATSTKLDAKFATAPDSGYSSWVSSGSVDLSKFSGTIYIAFRYSATSDANYATWCVDNVKVNAK